MFCNQRKLVFIKMGCAMINEKKKQKQNVGKSDFTLSDDALRALNDGLPVNFKGGITIVKNVKTGKLEGVPKEWVDKYYIPLEVDKSKLVSSKAHPSETKGDEHLPQSILKLATQKQISYFKSQINPKLQEQSSLPLEIDQNQPYGIRGLTPQLVHILQFSKISERDARRDPEALIEMLNNYHNEIVRKKLTRHLNLITTEEFQTKMQSITFIETNPTREFIFQKQLGKGSSCKVYIAIDRKNEDKIYAVRIMKVKEARKIDKIKRQIAVMQLCAANNIVNYYFSYYYKNLLFMFIEYMEEGCLTEFIYNHINNIPESVIAYILREVLIGLDALHSKRQIHRDLKSDNILIGSEGEVKIADFGFAIQLTKERDNRVSLVGTPAWMAPQLVQKKNYDETVDIWSLGMVAMELCLGQPPFLNYEHMKTMYMIVSCQIPPISNFSAELTSFVEGCLQKNPKNRLTAHQLLEHPFIKNIGDGKRQKAAFVKMIREKQKLNSVMIK